MWGGTPQFNRYSSDIKKLEMVLSSPAVLKVFSILCDLYSQGEIYVYKNGKEVEGAPELALFEQPNPFQTEAQWKWTYMFWTLIGNCNLYIDKNVADASNKMYFLVPHKIEWPQWFTTNQDKLFFSKTKMSELEEQQVKYRYNDGTSIDIPFKKIVQYFDMSNGTGNWFKGNSKLDALCKIVDISESALDAQKINVQFSGQFLVAGASDPNDVKSKALGPDEKKNIESKIRSDKPVHALKSMIEIHRFVSDLGALDLPAAYRACALQVADLYNLPKEVSALIDSGSTFENQEKARGAVVEYCLNPKSKAMLAPINNRCMPNKKRKFIQSWDHLSFMQYGERDRADVQLKRSVTIRNLQQAGATTDEINSYLDTNFSSLNETGQQQEQPASAGNQQGQQMQGDAGQGQAGNQEQANGNSNQVAI